MAKSTRITRDHLPSLAQPWPYAWVPEQDLISSLRVELGDGLYAAFYAQHDLRLYCRVSQGRVSDWLTLRDGVETASYSGRLGAQDYLQSGRSESRDGLWGHECGEQPAEDFRQWVRKRLRAIANVK